MEPLEHSPPIVRVFTREAVRALDRHAIDEFGIPGIVLMENAAVALEEACRRMLGGIADPSAALFCGTGNNGGDGFALARRLTNLGIACECVFLGDRGRVSGEARTNLDIAARMGIPIVKTRAVERPSLVVDALFGTGLSRPINGASAGAVDRINALRASGSRVLAVDLPSGLDCDTGKPLGDRVVRADVTVTLAGLKAGFAHPASRSFTGEILVGDIGVPTELLERFGREAG